MPGDASEILIAVTAAVLLARWYAMKEDAAIAGAVASRSLCATKRRIRVVASGSEPGVCYCLYYATQQTGSISSQ